MDDSRARPAWLTAMIVDLHRAVRGRRVLNLGCGSGHWAALAAETAEHVVGVDAGRRGLELARAAGIERASFVESDPYALDGVPGDLDAALAVHWLSQVPWARLGEILDGLHARLGPGAVVFLADEVVAAGPGRVDTYDSRTMPGGSEFRFVRNFFPEPELRAALGDRVTGFDMRVTDRWWWLTYTVASQPAPGRRPA